MTNKPDPLHILQIVGSMLGGVGAWTTDVLRHIDHRRFQIDFLVYFPYPEALEHEINTLGGRIITCAFPTRPWTFVPDFKRILRTYGPYDVIHSHIHYISGFILRLARKAGVPKCIAHSHMDFLPYIKNPPIFRRSYLYLTKHWIKNYANGGLAVSRAAADDLFGPNWRSDPRRRVLYCGINLSPFHNKFDRPKIREELSIPIDAMVIGHVGSLWEQKNHKFLVEVAAEVARREPRTHLLLVGDGPLRPEIERQIAEVGLGKKATLAGLRPDVPRLLRGAMDVFLFPSLYEGLPLALLEAQAAGLPCVISDAVTEEVDIIPSLIQRLSLFQSCQAWAEAVLAAKEAKIVITQSQALAQVENSPFNILNSVRELEKFYDSLD
jgi:glycosyltransferase involved in cell wall biosynthesis